MMGEFSGKSSNYEARETYLLVISQRSNHKERQSQLRQVLQDRRLRGLRAIKSRVRGGPF